MLRAAEAELGPAAPPPRSISAQFLDAPGTGAAELEVEVLRRGKRVSFCEVRLRQGGRLACTATVVFSAARANPFELPAPPPELPPRKNAPVFEPPVDAGFPPVFSQLVIQPTEGPRVFSGGEQAVTGGWLAIRGDDAPLDPARLTALCDLWWPAIFSMLDRPAGVPTLQLTVHLRRTAEPVLGPVFARFTTVRMLEGHIEETGELWSERGELLAQSQQLALLMPLTRGG
jgi:acyl-CoA thioesterase